MGIKFIPCESTGESLLEIKDGKITALQDCTISFNGGRMTALKKGETFPPKKDSKILTFLIVFIIALMCLGVFGALYQLRYDSNVIRCRAKCHEGLRIDGLECYCKDKDWDIEYQLIFKEDS